MLNYHVAKTSRPTGAILQQLVAEKLREQNIAIPDFPIEICYGLGYIGPNKSLNANCSRHNKLEQARILRQTLGDRALEVLLPPEAFANRDRVFRTLVGRKVVHTKGRDIKLCLEPWQVDAAIASGTEFFTPYVPSVREFRVWTYRNRHLGTYEKLLRHPENWRRVGRNYDNGFDFSGIENDAVPQALKDVSRDALRGLGLDFGAVDVLQEPNGNYVVLEVNSAPGVMSERRKVIVGLANRIARWINAGCPNRAAE